MREVDSNGLRQRGRLLLASGNQGKLREIETVLAGSGIVLQTLADHPELKIPPEDGDSFLENARIKARAIGEQSGEWVLSDDSGLIVEALGGAPGIHSARYAGPDADDHKNNLKLLAELEGLPAPARRAAFVCVLVLRSPTGEETVFEGHCPGRIADRMHGTGGFGYDPLFLVAPDHRLTMAQLSPEEKNRISHRGRALRQFQAWLQDSER